MCVYDIYRCLRFKLGVYCLAKPHCRFASNEFFSILFKSRDTYYEVEDSGDHFVTCWCKNVAVAVTFAIGSGWTLS